MTVPGWVYKRHAYGDISREELYELEKFAESISRTGALGAQAAVADKSNNLHKVMKNVPQEDRDDVLRALRQMKKQASALQDAKKGGTSRDVNIKGKSYKETRVNVDMNNPAHVAILKHLASKGNKGAASQLSAMKKQAAHCASSAKPSNAKKRLKAMSKKAALSGGQLATLMGGAALAPVASHLAMRGIDRMMQKSPAQVQQDLKKILQVHPDIGRPEDPRVQMAYASLMKLNPSYAEDPLIAGPLLKQIVDSRMNVADPNSGSYVDPHMAKTLSEARKAVNTGGPGYSLGSEMGRSLSGGIQQAGKMGIDF